MSSVTLLCGDCLDVMRGMSDSSIECVITSPPYWNQKSYSFWPTYTDYMLFIEERIGQVARVLKSGRHCFWVIPDKLPFPPKSNGTRERMYMPVYADTERIAADFGLICEYPIIWRKPHGTQRMFGSYPYPPTIIHTPMTERICVWRKVGKPDISKRGTSKIGLDDWSKYAVDTWDISPETHVNHPAPFPEELVRRILILWTFSGDVILDPFMGSGTTGKVCASNGRDFVGIEKESEYLEIAQKRIAATQAQIGMTIT